MKILITGGTGSLGKALLSRLETEDHEVVVFSRDETKQSILKRQYPFYRFVLGDVANKSDLRRAMYNVDVVYHFAAYKQVPSSQVNVSATLNTNVVGSRNVAEVAVEYGVHKVVATSTDKSCSPCNFYGASKYLMEGIFQEANAWGDTKFNLARYGNVVCSNASVIPLFIKQRDAGGPLTVTSFEMTRFWLSLGQALDLVDLALEQDAGVIVVPKAPAMCMKQLAEIVDFSGEQIVGLKETGIRPGEKMHEAMINPSESLHTTEDENHYFIYPAQSSLVTYSSTPFTYTSDNPKRWLDDIEMLNMIVDAGYKL